MRSCPGAEKPTPHPHVEDTTPGGSASIRALVADDDNCSLTIASRMLEGIGCRVCAVTGGLAAKQCLEKSRFDIVVTDLQMPDMDGYTLACWLKRKYMDTKVIIMTGACRSNVIEYIHTGTADGWLFKPFKYDTLRRMVRESLQHTPGGPPVDEVMDHGRRPEAIVATISP